MNQNDWVRQGGREYLISLFLRCCQTAGAFLFTHSGKGQQRAKKANSQRL